MCLEVGVVSLKREAILFPADKRRAWSEKSEENERTVRLFDSDARETKHVSAATSERTVGSQTPRPKVDVYLQAVSLCVCATRGYSLILMFFASSNPFSLMAIAAAVIHMTHSRIWFIRSPVHWYTFSSFEKWYRAAAARTE